MDERDEQDPLRDLGKRLDQARQRGRRPDVSPTGETDDSRNALAVGFRIGLELLVAVLVGAGLGWAFDSWLGTTPWGLIVFLLLGFAAGVINVFRIALGMERAVGYGQNKPGAQQAPGWDDEED